MFCWSCVCLITGYIFFFLFIHTFTVYQCDLHTFTHSGFSQLIFALLTTNLLRLSSCRRSTSCWQLHKKPTFYHSTRHVVWQSVGNDLWKSDLFRCTFIPDTFSTVCLCLVVPLNSSHWAVLAVPCDCFGRMHSTRWQECSHIIFQVAFFVCVCISLIK